MNRAYWEHQKDSAQTALDVAHKNLETFDDPQVIAEASIRLAGAGSLTTRHQVYVDDFNALTHLEMAQGRVAGDIGIIAMAKFHKYCRVGIDKCN